MTVKLLVNDKKDIVLEELLRNFIALKNECLLFSNVQKLKKAQTLVLPNLSEPAKSTKFSLDNV